MAASTFIIAALLLFLLGGSNGVQLPPLPGLSMLEGTQGDTWIYYVRDGWFYHVNRHTETVYFKCIYYERGCTGRALYRYGEGFHHSRSNPHTNHEQDHLYVMEMNMRHEVLQRCRNLDCISFRNIIDEVGRRYPVDVAARLTLPRLRYAMRRVRMEMYPPPPTTLRELTDIRMDPNFRVMTLTEDGTDFFYLGSVTAEDESHHVVFSSHRLLRFFETCTTAHSDGTFKIIPASLLEDAHQVFVIATSFMETTIPIAWTIMSSVTEVGYTAVLSLIRRSLGQDLHLTRSITDFEPAMRNSWENVFQPARTQGCFWHFCRAVLQFAVGLQLTWWIRNSAVARSVLRRLCAVALLPTMLIRRGFALIGQWANANADPALYRDLRPLFTYMWRYWINNRRRRRWIGVFRSEERTNNLMESQNRRLRDVMGVHPNIYVFLEGLNRLERTTVRDLVTLHRGDYEASRRRRNSALMNDLRLARLGNELVREVRRGRLNHPNPAVRQQHLRRINRAIFIYIGRASRVMENVFNEAFNIYN